jgi:hypothetical protein
MNDRNRARSGVAISEKALALGTVDKAPTGPAIEALFPYRSVRHAPSNL